MNHFLNVNQASSLTGLSKSSLYKLTAKRAIVHYKPAGKLYFKEEDLINYIESSKVITQDEIAFNAEQYLDEMENERKK